MRGNGKAQHKEHMKKISYFLILLFAASVIFTGCRSNDAPDPEYIVIDDGAVNQNVYADEVAGESGVRFITLAPWTSSIRTATTTTTARNAVDWVSISPESGGAGTHTITISLTPNFTGADRSAIIAITSGGTTIEIRITQQRVTEGGEPPVNPDDHSIVRAENIIGDDFSEVVTVIAEVWWYDGEESGFFTVAEAPFVNSGFTLQLNDVPVSFLESWFYYDIEEEISFVISDRNAKINGVGFFDAFNSNNDRIGYFALASRISEYERYEQHWLYVDRDVTVKGTNYDHFSKFIIDLDLRRGWNIVYEYRNFEGFRQVLKTTSQKPADVNFRWEFWSLDFEDWSSRSATTRATENRRSVFRR